MSTMRLTPYIVDKIWGGNKLSTLKNLNPQRIGETWEVSTHKEGLSRVGGQSLKSIIQNELSYLVKFIDTSDHLSVQVHPNDEYASRVENSLGKTECWIILDSEPGAGIYLGFEKGVTKEQFHTDIIEGKDLSSSLIFYPVKRGDFFFVPAGAVHAIGKGVTLIEAQQSSGITYRVWDWNRVDDSGKPRELHVNKALDVLNFDLEFNNKDNFHVKNSVLDLEQRLVSHKDFFVEILKLNKQRSLPLANGPVSVISLDETIYVNEMELPPYCAAFIDSKEVVLSTSKAATIILIGK